MDIEKLKSFRPFGLEELDSVNLFMNNRFESKFVFHPCKLDFVLQHCKTSYKILSVNGMEIFDYRNDYFDTENLQFYFNHHRQKPTRYKIRKRTYENSAIAFVEIKKKTPTGTTFKYRKNLENPDAFSDLLDSHTPYKPEELFPSLVIKYKRITLLNNNGLEKVTIDTGLCFENQFRTVKYENLVIAEVKTTDPRNDTFKLLMKSIGIRPGGISKYCFGMISLHDQLKHNNFKPVFKRMIKLNAHV